jgi:hypothetical protein
MAAIKLAEKQELNRQGAKIAKAEEKRRERRREENSVLSTRI